MNNLKIKWTKKNSMTIVLCAKGYPFNYIKDSEIKNLTKILNDKNNQIFHAGTYEKNNKTYSNGGRVLNINKINWDDGFFRKDIGWRIINNK